MFELREQILYLTTVVEANYRAGITADAEKALRDELRAKLRGM